MLSLLFLYTPITPCESVGLNSTIEQKNRYESTMSAHGIEAYFKFLYCPEKL